MTLREFRSGGVRQAEDNSRFCGIALQFVGARCWTVCRRPPFRPSSAVAQQTKGDPTVRIGNCCG